ncbi:hypothetical protein Agub_g11245, partial [Astrephomene gubernaculifera]
AAAVAGSGAAGSNGGSPARHLGARVLLLPAEAEPEPEAGPGSASAAAPAGLAARRVVRVTEAVMKKVSGVENARGVTAVAELDLPPERSLAELLAEAATVAEAATPTSSSTVPNDSQQHQPSTQSRQRPPQTSQPQPSSPSPPPPVRLLVLDGVQDPGNLGTLVRTALAFGWQGVFLLPGCCDPFNDKALRASR